MERERSRTSVSSLRRSKVEVCLDTSAVLVMIKHEPLATPETLILEYLENHDSIKNKEARELCHISGDYIIKDLFGRLTKRELIERVPGTRTSSTVYRKGPKFDPWKKKFPEVTKAG